MNLIRSLFLAIVLLCAIGEPAFANPTPLTTTLTAPSPGQTFSNMPSGTTYKADASGNVSNVLASDVPAMLKAGCTQPTSGGGGGGGATLPYPGIVYGTSPSGGTVATSNQIQSAIGSGVYDASGAAAAAQAASDPSGAAAAVKSYFTALTGILSCNGTGCTASSTLPATSITGLAPSATTDTTNAANITSGTLLAARVPGLTGDVTKAVGSAATTVTGINGATVPASAALLSTNGSGQQVATTLANVGAQPQTFGLPTVSAAPLAVYSTRLLVPTYTGPLFRIVNISNSSTLDIYPNADGSPNLSGVYSLLNGATQANVSIVYDQTGTGNNATQATAGSQPFFTLTNAINGVASITFDGNQNNGTMVLPSSLTGSGQATTIVNIAAPESTNAATVSMVGAAQATAGSVSSWYGYPGYNNKASVVTSSNVYSVATAHSRSQVQVLGVASGTSNISIYQDNYPAQTVTASPAGTWAGGLFGGGGYSAYFNGEWFGMVIYPAALTATDFGALMPSLNKSFNIITGATAQLVSPGNSIVQGTKATLNQNNLRQTETNLNRKIFISNQGVYGQLEATEYSNLATYQAEYNSAFQYNLALAPEPTNDIGNAATGSIVGVGTTLFNSDTVPFVQGMQTTGFTMLVPTIIARNWANSNSNTTSQAQMETERLAYNALVRANAATYGYTVLDYASLPQLSNYSNATYISSSDGTHPTSAGYAAMAVLQASVVNQILNGAQPAGATLAALQGVKAWPTKRVPAPTDDSSVGYSVGNFWNYGGRTYVANSVAVGAANWSPTAANSSPPCNTTTASCYAAYGVYKLNSAYTGNAFAVTRASGTPAVLQVPFGVDNVASWSMVDTFCAGTTCGVSTWYDQSGNGYDAVQSTAASQPLIFGGLVNGKRAISFVGTNTIANASIPFSNLANTTTVMVMHPMQSWGSGTFPNQGLFMLSSSTANYGLAVYNNATYGLSIYSQQSGGGAASNNPIRTMDEVFMLQGSGGTWNVTQNDQTFQRTGYATSGTSTGLTIGEASNSSYMLSADVTAFIVYNSSLSSADQTALLGNLYGSSGIQPQSNDLVVWQGDSITYGQMSVSTSSSSNIPGNAPLPQHWFEMLPTLTDHPFASYNLGEPGYPLQYMVGQTAGAANLTSTSGVNKIAVVWGGTNDIGAFGLSGATVYGYFQTICGYWHAAGFKCVIVSPLPRTGSLSVSASAFETQRQALISLMATGWPSFADGFVNVGADPVIGTQAAASNSAYYGDGIHPTALAATYISADMQASLKGLLQ